ncbi:P-type conjugative transfer protein TrbL [Neisseria gonorrhoeae]
MKKKYIYYFIFFITLSMPIISHAAGQGGVLDEALSRYEGKIGAWEAAFYKAGLFIFWSLSSISIVMTGAQLIFQRDNISSFFAEFTRLILFLGFFLWIITNGIKITTSIKDGLMKLAGQASRNGEQITPSSIVDIGFNLFDKIVENSSIWDPIDSATLIVIGLVILLILAAVGINMLLMLITTYIVIYSGIIILGFGGGRWTSDMAVGYLKQVLNLSLQLAAMILIIGIGQSIVQDTINTIGTPGFRELAVVLVQTALLVGLVVKIPPMIGSLAGGAGSGGIGSFGVGSAITATAMVAGAAAGAGAALKSLATEAGGLIKAFQAAKAGLGGSNNSSGSPDSGSRKMDSAVDAVGGASAGDKSNQDGKPLAAESSGASGGNSGNSSGGSTTGNSGGNPSGSSGENTISSGSSSSSGEANSTNTSASSGAEGSAEGEATSSETSQSASDSPSNNSGEATQTADTTPKTTNTGGGSPLATAMGGNKVSNWQAAKNVAVGLVSSKWNNAVNNSAGGRLVKHWEDEKKKTEDPTKNPQKNPEGDDNA